MSVAIITGASSGLGEEFVRAVIDERPDIEELWLIARRKDRLEEIVKSYPQRKFKILSVDLSAVDEIKAIEFTLSAEKPDIRLLINNAGMVASNSFRSLDLQMQEKMISLNSIAPTALIHFALPYMKSGSAIINVCSVAGFAPTPDMLVYSSTKAYLYNFTKGLRAELRQDGIHVLALCPGNMRTEMFTMPAAPCEHKSIVNLLPFLNIKKVMRRALRLARRNRGVYTPHLFYKCYRLIAKIIPHEVLVYFSKV